MYYPEKGAPQSFTKVAQTWDKRGYPRDQEAMRDDRRVVWVDRADPYYLGFRVEIYEVGDVIVVTTLDMPLWGRMWKPRYQRHHPPSWKIGFMTDCHKKALLWAATWKKEQLWKAIYRFPKGASDVLPRTEAMEIILEARIVARYDPEVWEWIISWCADDWPQHRAGQFIVAYVAAELRPIEEARKLLQSIPRYKGALPQYPSLGEVGVRVPVGALTVPDILSSRR